MSNSGGNENPLIGLVGPAGSGKDTVAGLLVESHGFRRVAFADALKEFVAAIDPAWRIAVNCFEGGVNAAKRHVPGIRERLIEVGDAARTHIKSGIWVDAVADLVEGLPASVSVVVSDVRRQNEAEWLLDEGGLLIAVRRPGMKPEDRIMAELIDGADYTIVNDGSLDELAGEVVGLAEWLELDR